MKHFARDGFAIVPAMLDADAISALITAIEHADENAPVSRRAMDTYALRNLLQTIPAVKTLAASAPVRALVEEILGRESFPVRGLLFDKTPAANWKVAWHQDMTIAVRERREVPGYGPWSMKAGIPHVQPPAAILEKMLTLRLHLDDCTETNGPLQILPGSHLSGKLDAAEIQSWRARVAPVSCTVARGGALLMRPLLLHASSAATQPAHRRVIHLEFAAEKLHGNLQWHD